MHNYDANAHLLPRKLALPSLGGAGGGSPFWAGSKYLLFSFTKAIAGRAVLKNKSVAVGNRRVLSLVDKLLVVSVLREMSRGISFPLSDYFAICVKTRGDLRHFTIQSDAECTLI